MSFFPSFPVRALSHMRNGSLWKVVLEDDLADVCKPGDDVTVSGIVLRRWRPLRADERCEAEVVVQANHVVVNNEQVFRPTKKKKKRNRTKTDAPLFSPAIQSAGDR